MPPLPCEDSVLLQEANKKIANLKETIQWLSDELQKKESLLSSFMDVATGQSKWITDLSAAIQDTVLWDPSTCPWLFSCFMPNHRSYWAEVVTDGCKRHSDRAALPPRLSLSNHYTILLDNTLVHPADVPVALTSPDLDPLRKLGPWSRAFQQIPQPPHLAPFLRLSCDTSPQIIYTLMTAHWGLPSPNLVVSVVGGEGNEKIKTWVRDVLRNGLVKAAQSTGAWILTGGLREGVARCVGEAVRDHGAAAPALSQKKVIAVGLAPWGLVHNRQRLVNAQGSFPARYYVQNTSRDSCCLDKNCQAFLLVDDGSIGRRGGETAFRANLEDYISHQRTGIWGSGSIEIPVLCMLISGDANMLERLDASLRKATPWLVLAGTGPAADLISELLGNLSPVSISPTSPSAEGEAAESLSTELRDRVREKIRKHFPAEAELEKLVDSVSQIAHV
eukprot:superscaffoldBa00001922_g12521